MSKIDPITRKKAEPAPGPRPMGRSLIDWLASARADQTVEELVHKLEEYEAVRQAEEQDEKRATARRFVPDLEAWNALADDVKNLPVGVGVALMTNRHNLILGISDEEIRHWTPEMVRGVIDLVRVLLATNKALQRHSAEVAERAANFRGHLYAAAKSADGLWHLANFRDEAPDEGDDD